MQGGFFDGRVVDHAVDTGAAEVPVVVEVLDAVGLLQFPRDDDIIAVLIEGPTPPVGDEDAAAEAAVDRAGCRFDAVHLDRIFRFERSAVRLVGDCAGEFDALAGRVIIGGIRSRDVRRAGDGSEGECHAEADGGTYTTQRMLAACGQYQAASHCCADACPYPIRVRGFLPPLEKESGEDYRFIVDPDLPVLVLDSAFVKRQKDCLPETPDVKLARLIDEYKIDKSHANILTKNIDLVEFFERVSEKIDAKFALHWVTVELLRVLNYNKKKLDEIDIAPEHFITLLELVKFGKITELQAKQILNKFVPKSFKPEAGAGKISDVKELERVIRQVIEKNPLPVFIRNFLIHLLHF